MTLIRSLVETFGRVVADVLTTRSDYFYVNWCTCVFDRASVMSGIACGLGLLRLSCCDVLGFCANLTLT